MKFHKTSSNLKNNTKQLFSFDKSFSFDSSIDAWMLHSVLS